MEESALNSTYASSELSSLTVTHFGSILVLNAIIICSLCINISVILITYVGKCMEQNPNSIYVLSLAVADLLKGVFFFSNGIIVEYYNFKTALGRVPFIMCVIPRALIHTASLFSGYTLLLTSFVQYVAVAHPHFHKKWMKGKFSRFAIMVGWIICVIQTLCVFIFLLKPDTGNDIECNDYDIFGSELYVKNILEVLYFWISLSILTVLNGKLVREILRIGNQVSQSPNENSNTTSVHAISMDNDTKSSVAGGQSTLSRTEHCNIRQIQRQKNKLWKPVITLIVSVVSFAVSLGPYAVYFTVEIFSSHGGNQHKPSKLVVRILSLGILANTLINPLIYAFRIPVYRRFIETKILKTRM